MITQQQYWKMHIFEVKQQFSLLQILKFFTKFFQNKQLTLKSSIVISKWPAQSEALLRLLERDESQKFCC
ncbi:unnamed protein product [Paramecium sonneborni]|uniref:Uncharacterized protein n=1 Tax=Paramecium sonneborni TaxID=65129 RepID=A0A8S1R047_9CILI|nr:unnamed protein product [Paramecium sonneborni]